ncbi:MAG: cell division protein FtsQ [candidate division BRC1 bacterium ADurb.BinA292]|nr:MAG: cell division protein FtsQ [candidate division BRC1 bacterium ADurb.BinA292]
MSRPSQPRTGPSGRTFRESFLSRAGRLIRRVLTLCLLAGCVAGGYFIALRVHDFVYASDYFKVREMRIGGASTALEAEARAWIEQRFAQDGDNLCRLDMDQLARELTALPRARRAEARRRFPDALLISFVEREPEAVVNLDRPHLIDRDGVILAQADPGEVSGLGLPVITGIRNGAWQPGDRILQRGLDEILEAARFVRTADPRIDRLIVEWNLDGRDEVSAILRGGTQVLFGDIPPLHLLDKLSTALTAREDLTRARYIDLRMQKQVVFKM